VAAAVTVAEETDAVAAAVTVAVEIEAIVAVAAEPAATDQDTKLPICKV
jgi:hypothetical protein